MTEYWVSQGNKWCDFCKIYIANNAVSIRTHELGQRHKDNVAKKITGIRKDNANKEKEKLKAMKELQHIEAKAVKSYQDDIKAGSSAVAAPTLTSSKISQPASMQSQHTYSAKSTVSQLADANEAKIEWFEDASSGYQFNPATGHYYDPKSGFYYSDVLGQWTTEEEALKAAQLSKAPGAARKPPPATAKGPLGGSKAQPQQVVKGRPSSVDVRKNNNKRRREANKKQSSSEEAAALAAREAARKRVQEREKGLMGLYQAY